ncbi:MULTISPECIES: ShlB/FhaC/HecB family hemolysin secretion/activation protein [unclassified Polaromonas]|uniref:ShlB/FhaC/HecB family hemolysin secretion/activation protein n=1 Tax=unclassified Polaromonas TaxID=2638319 RepID=UPI000F089A62|nr:MULTISPECIES: ShlB/FhaC/HecB family hemolysin secretion/activation protein [unclassified Polaromonas]AYQ27797.1 ShlB/FhaC/HecB family hemolysin secretion/activation protein [Polaromonas sp. SP1]QGJ17345.1 BamA/TamA family outer membrane protein [Polaromonas sp. Pch-P]
MGVLGASAAMGSAVLAQVRADVRPDAGTLLELPGPLPLLPPRSGPAVDVPEPRATAPAPGTARMTPAAFSFTGNTVFSGELLAALLAPRVNQPTDLAGLTEAANTIKAYYRSQGYLLTQAYLPEQAFAAEGGTVTIAILEARIGRVTVRTEGAGISQAFAESIVAGQLKRGDAVTEYALDKPVLLLRDLAGYDAGATVEPGERPGEADVLVAVNARGPRADGSVSVDNHGARAAGAARVMLGANLNNLLGHGDALALSAQQSDQAGSALYRIGYTLPVGAYGTRLGINAARLDYTLGKQFEALGASGRADILGLSVSHPLLRGRSANLYGLVSAEQKKLLDETRTPTLKSARDIVAIRAGLVGNFNDSMAGSGALNSYAVNATFGRLTLNAADQALDDGLGGLRTAGGFSKLNLEFQRSQYFDAPYSFHVAAQAQLASKNLSSAEKMVLGGPGGVRGYPVGEGVGDAGFLLNLETRYQLPQAVWGEPLSLLAFYDFGRVRFNQNGPTVPGNDNTLSLGAFGVGATLGRPGRFLIKTYLAWRTTPAQPSTGDPDRSPRAWISAQTWF